VPRPRPKQERRTHIRSVRFRPEEEVELRRMALARRWSCSKLIRNLIEVGLREARKSVSRQN